MKCGLQCAAYGIKNCNLHPSQNMGIYLILLIPYLMLTINHIHKKNVHNSLISYTKLNTQFLYSSTICTLHYNPRHVSRINMPIFRKKNCIITASGIVTFCKRLYRVPDERSLQSALIRHIVLYCTESDDTGCCDNTICSPEDGHVNARNMSRIVV
jgi:hypothetical protein